MFRRLLWVGLVLFSISQMAEAQKVTYLDADQPAFSVTYPDSWIVRTPRIEGRNVISSYPNDGSLLWQGMWIMREARTVEESIERIKNMELGLFEDSKLKKDPWVERVGDLDAKCYSGSGLYKGARPVETFMAFFELSDQRVGVFGYIGEPDAIEANRGALEDMLYSLEVAR